LDQRLNLGIVYKSSTVLQAVTDELMKDYAFSPDSTFAWRLMTHSKDLTSARVVRRRSTSRTTPSRVDEYSDPSLWGPENVSVALEGGGDLLGMLANETEQMQKAMIQLGSCIKRSLDPLSPNLS